MKHPGMSQRILDRRRKRRLLHLRWTAWFAALAVCMSSMVFMAIRADRAYRAVHSPSWAEFKVNSDMKSTVLEANPQGVPYKLTINGEQWDLVKVDHFDDAEGIAEGVLHGGVMAQTYCVERMISYIQVEDPNQLRVNLWHEIMHAGDCLHGGDHWWDSPVDTKFTHEGVTHLGEFLGTFSHDNPRFLAWASR